MNETFEKWVERNPIDRKDVIDLIDASKFYDEYKEIETPTPDDFSDIHLFAAEFADLLASDVFEECLKLPVLRAIRSKNCISVIVKVGKKKAERIKAMANSSALITSKDVYRKVMEIEK